MPTWLQVLVWAGAGVGAVYMLVTKGVVPLWNFVVSAQRLAEAVPTIMAIHEEFQPNSGESLMDKIDAIVVGQDNIQQQLENRILSHDEYHEDIERRLEQRWTRSRDKPKP